MTSWQNTFQHLWLPLFWPGGWFLGVNFFLDSKQGYKHAFKAIVLFYSLGILLPFIYYLCREGFYQLGLIAFFGWIGLLRFQEFFLRNRSGFPPAKTIEIKGHAVYALTGLYNGVLLLGSVLAIWVFLDTSNYFEMPNWKLGLLFIIALSFGLSFTFRNIYPKCPLCRFPFLHINLKDKASVMVNRHILLNGYFECPHCKSHVTLKFKT